MTGTDFDMVVDHRLDQCKKVLSSKKKEYADEGDRLHNFKQAGMARGRQPSTALDGMLMKHLVSVWDIIDHMEEDPAYIPDAELVAEKFGDVINYMLLLEGLIIDRKMEILKVERPE